MENINNISPRRRSLFGPMVVAKHAHALVVRVCVLLPRSDRAANLYAKCVRAVIRNGPQGHARACKTDGEVVSEGLRKMREM